MQILKTTYRNLQNGDRVWVQGHCFIARNVRIASRKGDKVSMHSEPNTDDVIRFEGDCANAKDSIARTSYNGGTYGGYAFVTVTIERD